MSRGQWIHRSLGGRLLQWELILIGKKHKEKIPTLIYIGNIHY